METIIKAAVQHTFRIIHITHVYYSSIIAVTLSDTFKYHGYVYAIKDNYLFSQHSPEPRIVEGPRNTTALQGHRVWLHCVVSTVSAATTASLPLTSPLPILTSTISPAAVTNSVTYVTTTPAKLNNTVRTPVLSSTTPINSSISAHPIDASRHAPTFDPPEREETRVTWQRDGRSLHTTIEGSAWTVLANGSLRLNSVDHVDAGPYRCIARNRNGVAFSQPAYLTVHSEYKSSIQSVDITNRCQPIMSLFTSKLFATKCPMI